MIFFVFGLNGFFISAQMAAFEQEWQENFTWVGKTN